MTNYNPQDVLKSATLGVYDAGYHTYLISKQMAKKQNQELEGARGLDPDVRS